MPEPEKRNIYKVEAKIIKPPSTQIGRRTFLAAGGLALVCLLAHEPNLVLASPASKPRQPIEDDEILHTIIKDRFGRTEVAHGKNTLTGSLSLTPAHDLLQRLDAINLFPPEETYTPILEPHKFDKYQFAYTMAGLVNPKTPDTPYQLSVDLVSDSQPIGFAETEWLSSKELAALLNLTVVWENGEIVEAVSVSR